MNSVWRYLVTVGIEEELGGEGKGNISGGSRERR